MAGVDLLVGGIVGTLCSELYNLVATLIKKTNEFSPLLEAIKSTVGGLESLIPRIEDLNEKLKISNKEIDRLKKTLSEGVELVGKCSNNPRWYEKAKYTVKLTALDEALRRELNMLKAHAARDAKENLLLARKNQGQLVELARDWRKWLGMVRKHGDQLGESVKDGRETFCAVEEIKKLIDKLLKLWILGLTIIIVVWVILLIFSHLGESKRIATAVPDWKILSRSRCKVCKSVVGWTRVGVFLVGSLFNLLGSVNAVVSIFFSIAADITLEIRAQHQQGFSGSRVCRLLFSIGFSAFAHQQARAQLPNVKVPIPWEAVLRSRDLLQRNIFPNIILALSVGSIFLYAKKKKKEGANLQVEHRVRATPVFTKIRHDRSFRRFPLPTRTSYFGKSDFI